MKQTMRSLHGMLEPQIKWQSGLLTITVHHDGLSTRRLNQSLLLVEQIDQFGSGRNPSSRENPINQSSVFIFLKHNPYMIIQIYINSGDRFAYDNIPLESCLVHVALWKTQVMFQVTA